MSNEKTFLGIFIKVLVGTAAIITSITAGFLIKNNMVKYTQHTQSFQNIQPNKEESPTKITKSLTKKEEDQDKKQYLTFAIKKPLKKELKKTSNIHQNPPKELKKNDNSTNPKPDTSNTPSSQPKSPDPKTEPKNEEKDILNDYYPYLNKEYNPDADGIIDFLFLQNTFLQSGRDYIAEVTAYSTYNTHTITDIPFPQPYGEIFLSGQSEPLRNPRSSTHNSTTILDEKGEFLYQPHATLMNINYPLRITYNQQNPHQLKIEIVAQTRVNDGDWYFEWHGAESWQIDEDTYKFYIPDVGYATITKPSDSDFTQIEINSEDYRSLSVAVPILSGTYLNPKNGFLPTGIINPLDSRKIVEKHIYEPTAIEIGSTSNKLNSPIYIFYTDMDPSYKITKSEATHYIDLIQNPTNYTTFNKNACDLYAILVFYIDNDGEIYALTADKEKYDTPIENSKCVLGISMLTDKDGNLLHPKGGNIFVIDLQKGILAIKERVDIFYEK